jgi:hypothetical protein
VDRGKVNDQFRSRYADRRDRPFGREWWDERPVNLPAAGHRHWHNYWGRDQSGNWWKWASAGAITGWIAYGWTQPQYYSYGSGGTVYYENNQVYVDGEVYATSDEYYDQANTIAETVPEMTDDQAAQVEWMPLGVFAIAKDGVDATNLLLQLAVSKEGILAGSLYNESTESNRPIEGSIDKDTQRAAWKIVDGKNQDTVMETGVYNLTENECTALVHFGAEKTQEVVLVRLDDPAAAPAEE